MTDITLDADLLFFALGDHSQREHAQFTDYLYSCYYLGKPRHRKRI